MSALHRVHLVRAEDCDFECCAPGGVWTRDQRLEAVSVGQTVSENHAGPAQVRLDKIGW